MQSDFINHACGDEWLTMNGAYPKGEKNVARYRVRCARCMKPGPWVEGFVQAIRAWDAMIQEQGQEADREEARKRLLGWKPEGEE